MFSLKRWMLLTFAGWFIGICLVVVFSIIFDSIGLEGWQFIIAVGMGLGVGFMQWLAIKKFIPVTISWAWYTVVGLVAPLLVFDLLLHFSGLPEQLIQADHHIIYYFVSVVVLLVSMIVGGLIIGLLQAALLKKSGQNASGWVLASLAGWLLAVLAFSGINYTGRISDNNMVLFSLNLSLMLVGGPLLGYATGKAMQKILQREAPAVNN